MVSYANACLLASAIALVASCGAAPKSCTCATTAVPKPASEPAPFHQDRRDIAMYVAETRAWAKEMKLPEYDVRARSWCTGLRVQHECQRTCLLATHIAENTEDICRLAGADEDNEWAARQCDDARKLTRRAERACCRCPDPPERPEIF